MAGKLMFGVLEAAFVGLVGLAYPAAAQDTEMGKDIWLEQADCTDCHGWAGNGIPDEPRSSKSANLRETVLTQDELIEVILCGRPTTAMPHYDVKAYRDDRCYGITREDLGADTPAQGEVALVRRHAIALAIFITEWFKGAGEVTFEFCVNLMGLDSIRCDTLEQHP